MREQWEEKVLQASGKSSLKELERPVDGRKHGYPLLGDFKGSSPKSRDIPPLAVSLVFTESFDEDKMIVLKESVAEWTMKVPCPPADSFSSSSLLDLRVTKGEASFCVDLHLLRNVAEIRRLQLEHPDIEKWTLFLSLIHI